MKSSRPFVQLHECQSMQVDGNAKGVPVVAIFATGRQNSCRTSCSRFLLSPKQTVSCKVDVQPPSRSYSQLMYLYQQVGSDLIKYQVPGRYVRKDLCLMEGVVPCCVMSAARSFLRYSSSGELSLTVLLGLAG